MSTTPTLVAPRGARRAAGLAVAALLVVSTACGDGDPPTASSASTTTASTLRGSQHPTDSAHGGTVDVTAVDFAFDGLPAKVEAGTRLTLRNGAAHELHELVAFRLPDDEDRSVTEILRLSEAEIGTLLGAPKTVLLAAPGAEQIAAVGDGTLAEAGRYLVMCAIPTGVDPATYLKAAAETGGEKPDVAGGPPHFVSGMLAELTVT
ncbi:MAG: hypothetical protein R2698_14705 [Microthrixaceae bacterium]